MEHNGLGETSENIKLVTGNDNLFECKVTSIEEDQEIFSIINEVVEKVHESSNYPNIDESNADNNCDEVEILIDKEAAFKVYQQDVSSESDIESSSSDSDLDSSSETTTTSSSDEEIVTKRKPKEKTEETPSKTKGEVGIEDLPPIEELQITVPEDELMKIGIVTSIVQQLLVIQSFKDVSPLDLDSVLFTETGKSLGKVFDVFGPVAHPSYAIRFNDENEIIEKGIKTGQMVYFAPSHTDITTYVFTEALRRMKGSDASWENNNEPPEKFLEYSDDEEEKKAKKDPSKQNKLPANSQMNNTKRRPNSFNYQKNRQYQNKRQYERVFDQQPRMEFSGRQNRMPRMPSMQSSYEPLMQQFPSRNYFAPLPQFGGPPAFPPFCPNFNSFPQYEQSQWYSYIPPPPPPPPALLPFCASQSYSPFPKAQSTMPKNNATSNNSTDSRPYQRNNSPNLYSQPSNQQDNNINSAPVSQASSQSAVISKPFTPYPRPFSVNPKPSATSTSNISENSNDKLNKPNWVYPPY